MSKSERGIEMKGINLVILLTLLLLSPYAFAQPSSCPCDTHELPNGISGNDIIALVCPGGELVEGASFDLTPLVVRVISEEGDGYSVQNIPDSIGCGIVSMGVGEGVSITAEEAAVCRVSLIERCGLNVSRITPIPSISEWGMLATAAGLGIIGLLTTVRRKIRNT